MKNVKKLLVLLLCAILLVGATAAGTMAYLTDTKAVKNTFTVGKVNITLTEAKINTETGKKLTGDAAGRSEVGFTNIKAIPGRSIEKDPMVTVVKGSEDCYVRMFMTISWSEEADKLFDPQDSQGWFNFSPDWVLKAQKLDEDGSVVGTEIYEFWYKGKVPANKGEDTDLTALFTQITVPGTLEPKKFASLDQSAISIVAQAVQAEGFTDAAAAFGGAGYPEGIPELTPITPST